jgi:hypothetical protein
MELTKSVAVGAFGWGCRRATERSVANMTDEQFAELFNKLQESGDREKLKHLFGGALGYYIRLGTILAFAHQMCYNSIRIEVPIRAPT